MGNEHYFPFFKKKGKKQIANLIMACYSNRQGLCECHLQKEESNMMPLLSEKPRKGQMASSALLFYLLNTRGGQ